jgi:hypothetical protein
MLKSFPATSLRKILGGGGIVGSPFRAPQKPSERWRADRLMGFLRSPKLRNLFHGRIQRGIRKPLQFCLEAGNPQAKEEKSIRVIGYAEQGIHREGVSPPAQEQRDALPSHGTDDQELQIPSGEFRCVP